MIKSLLIILALVAPIFAATVDPDCGGTVNDLPLITAEPQLVDEVPNGRKFLVQNPQNETVLYIVALNGSWYDMGLAYGQLMKAEINDAVPGMITYLANQTDSWINIIKDHMPFFLKWIPNLMSLDAHDLLLAVLDLQHTFTAKYTPQRYTDQFKGMADGSGLDEKLLTDVNLLPELIRASCSMAGVWGPASATTKLVQLRALDWDYQAYVAKYPTAVIYFPEEEGSNNFATFGFAGLVGAISGFSTNNAISEKVWLPISEDPMSEFGEPFAYILRDILQFGKNLQSSIDIVFNASRTCKVHVGIGALEDNCFEGLEMDFNELYIFNDKNYTDYSAAHPQMDGIMFWDKHPQPSNHTCLGGLLHQAYGEIDSEYLYRTAAPLHQTGDTQLIVYDFENGTVYYAGSDPINGIKAFTRPMLRLDMNELLTKENIF